MDVARLGNKYLADTQPWHEIKTNPERVKTIMNIALQIVEQLAIVCEPFLPFTATKIWKQLGLHKGTSQITHHSSLISGNIIGEGFLLFEKIEDDVIAKQIQKLADSKTMNELETKKVPELRPTITFDDFAKLDIRIGTIIEAEKMPKSDKLLKFLIDDGIEKRVILSGIAKHYSPEEMLGKQVTFVANLAPRKMMGVESNGMILMAVLL